MTKRSNTNLCTNNILFDKLLWIKTQEGDGGAGVSLTLSPAHFIHLVTMVQGLILKLSEVCIT